LAVQSQRAIDVINVQSPVFLLQILASSSKLKMYSIRSVANNNTAQAVRRLARAYSQAPVAPGALGAGNVPKPGSPIAKANPSEADPKELYQAPNHASTWSTSQKQVIFAPNRSHTQDLPCSVCQHSVLRSMHTLDLALNKSTYRFNLNLSQRWRW
jgi:hypothetical protein